MRLIDIKEGRVKITPVTQIVYQGVAYRGKKAIDKLLAQEYPESKAKNARTSKPAHADEHDDDES